MTGTRVSLEKAAEIVTDRQAGQPGAVSALHVVI